MAEADSGAHETAPLFDFDALASASPEQLIERVIEATAAAATLSKSTTTLHLIAARVAQDLDALIPFKSATGDAAPRWPRSSVAVIVLDYRARYPERLTGPAHALRWALPTFTALDGRTITLPTPEQPSARTVKAVTLGDAAAARPTSQADKPAAGVAGQRITNAGEELFGGPSVITVRKPGDLFLAYLNSPEAAGRWLTAHEIASNITALTGMFRLQQLQAVPIGLGRMPPEKRALVQQLMISGKNHYAGTKVPAPLPEPEPNEPAAPAAPLPAQPVDLTGRLAVIENETIGGYIARRVSYLPSDHPSEGQPFLESVRSYLACGHHDLSDDFLFGALSNEVVVRLEENGFTVSREDAMLYPPAAATAMSSENPPAGD